MSSVTMDCTDRGDLQGVLLGCAFSCCSWKKCSVCPQLGEGSVQWHQRERGRQEGWEAAGQAWRRKMLRISAKGSHKLGQVLLAQAENSKG